MTPSSEERYSEKVHQLREWVAQGDYREPSAFVDALEYLYAIENRHRKRLGNELSSEKERYFSYRDSHQFGPVVGGIMYARGLYPHGETYQAVIRGSRPFTFGRSTLGGGDTLAGQGVCLVWRPSVELPPPDRREKNDRDSMYRDRVEGREVFETFDEVEVFFADMAKVR